MAFKIGGYFVGLGSAIMHGTDCGPRCNHSGLALEKDLGALLLSDVHNWTLDAVIVPSTQTVSSANTTEQVC